MVAASLLDRASGELHLEVADGTVPKPAAAGAPAEEAGRPGRAGRASGRTELT